MEYTVHTIFPLHFSNTVQPSIDYKEFLKARTPWGQEAAIFYVWGGKVTITVSNSDGKTNVFICRVPDTGDEMA
jgi:hypothetical protein